MVRGSSLQRELRSTSKGEKKKMLPALQGAGVFSEAKKAVPPSSGMDRQDRVMIFIVFDNILYPALIILTDVDEGQNSSTNTSTNHKRELQWLAMILTSLLSP